MAEVTARMVEAATEVGQRLDYTAMKPEELAGRVYGIISGFTVCQLALGRASALHVFLQCLTE